MNIQNTVSRETNWPIVILGFLALSIAFSGRAALGLIMPVWQNEFGWSNGFVSNVGATALIIMAMTAPFAGRMLDKMGPRFTLNLGLILVGTGCGLVALMNGQVMFMIGFAGFAGVGFGIVATHVVATAVARRFNNNVGLATGIATSGATGGQLLIVPLIAGLLTLISWRWSFGALSIMSFMLLPFLYRSLKEDSGQTLQKDNSDSDESSLKKDLLFIIQKPAFHVLFWSFLICGFTTTGVIETHLLPFASFCGFPPLPSATAYGVLSAVNLIGMIGVGWLTDRVNRGILLASIYFLRSITFVILTNLTGSSVETLFIFAVLFGAVDYSTVPITASLLASHVGLKLMGLAMGLIAAGHAVGGALGAFLGGYFFDNTGAYQVLWLSSLWLAVGAGLLVLYFPVKSWIENYDDRIKT